jgi:general secretion pathway protein L
VTVVRQRVERFIRWWLDNLTGFVESLAVGAQGREGIELRPDADGYTICQIGRGGDVRIGQVVQGGGTVVIEPAGLEQEFAGRPVAVIIPPDWLFEQALEPFPKESEPVIPGIVRHQIERVTPFRANDTIYDYSVEPMADESRRLLITVSVVPKGLVAGVIAAVSAGRPQRLELVARPARGGERRLVVGLGGGGGASQRLALRRVVAGVVGGSIGLFLLVAIGANWWLSSLAAETDDLQAAISDRQRLLGAATKADGSKAVDEPTRLRRLKAGEPSAVELLDLLSQLLPDDAYLTEFSIDHQRVRLIGISRDVSKLIPAIESSPRFGAAVFASPTTRLAQDQGDRFHIEVTVRGAEGNSP